MHAPASLIHPTVSPVHADRVPHAHVALSVSPRRVILLPHPPSTPTYPTSFRKHAMCSPCGTGFSSFIWPPFSSRIFQPSTRPASSAPSLPPSQAAESRAPPRESISSTLPALCHRLHIPSILSESRSRSVNARGIFDRPRRALGARNRAALRAHRTTTWARKRAGTQCLRRPAFHHLLVSRLFFSLAPEHFCSTLFHLMHSPVWISRSFNIPCPSLFAKDENRRVRAMNKCLEYDNADSALGARIDWRHFEPGLLMLCEATASWIV
jgi:hypothetical protein